ncbi:MAG: class B sortase, partial [Clostridia bacterium]|nr:class B sortase [Clostridia bacterium]
EKKERAEKSAEKPFENGKMSSKSGPFDIIRYALLFICFTVFLYCSYTLLSSIIERSQSRELYDDMRRIFYDDAGFEDSYLTPGIQNVTSVDLLSAFVGVQPPQPEIQVPTGSKLVDKVNYLKSINRDTVGWLTVDGTNIDYPVVHSDDNDYYLRRDFYGRSNLAGTLFTDSRNSMKLMENRNTVIYGHNMNDGSMFNNLHDFKNESVFKNSKIQFVTANGIFIYEVFSVHEALETSEYFQTDFENDQHFASYLADMQAQSIFKKEGLTLSPADKVLTLSTCIDPILQSEYRWALHAKLVQIVDYTP